MRIATVVGARPQFVKAAVVSRVLRDRATRGEPSASETLIHTGQHFDPEMSGIFFEELEISPPAHDLGLGGGSHGEMTGRMLEAIERILLDAPFDWVLVYGDTNSTLAGALAAAKLHVPVAHVEAGLRSFNRRMPEEINRIVADHVASLHFAPTETAVANLLREGVDATGVALVGDVMYDAMIRGRAVARKCSDALERHGLEAGGYVLATVHRAENTDDPKRLSGIMAGLARLAAEQPVVLPVHPRTRRTLEASDGLGETAGRLTLIEPVGYLDMIRLEADAALIATDSGGVQKEAYFNGVPCLTLRDETEWVELVEAGANTLVGTDPAAIAAAGRAALGTRVAADGLYGDGRAGDKIVARLLEEAGS